MSCIINTGYPLGCRDNIGGVQRVLVKTFNRAQTYTYNLSGEILTGSTTETFYEIQQSSEVADFKQDGQHSVENGTNFWNQTVSLVFHKYQSSLRDFIYILAQQEVVFLIQDQNGTWVLVGEQNGANLTASTANAGKMYGDMNGSTVTLIGKEPKPAVVATPAYITTLTII